MHGVIFERKIQIWKCDENFETKYFIQVMFTWCYNAKKWILNGCANRKRWVKSLSILPQELLIRTTFQWGRCHANDVKFSSFLRNNLWAEAKNTVILLENTLLTPNRGLSKCHKMERNNLSLLQNLCEMCIATYHDNSHCAKLANQGIPGIWVGFAEDHPVGIYCIYNTKTTRISLTKDVTFLNNSYGEWSKIEKPVLDPVLWGVRWWGRDWNSFGPWQKK